VNAGVTILLGDAVEYRGDALVHQEFRRVAGVVRHCLGADHIAAFDAQRGRQAGVEVTPMTSLGRCAQRVQRRFRRAQGFGAFFGFQRHGVVSRWALTQSSKLLLNQARMEPWLCRKLRQFMRTSRNLNLCQQADVAGLFAFCPPRRQVRLNNMQAV